MEEKDNKRTYKNRKEWAEDMSYEKEKDEKMKKELWILKGL